MAKYQAYAEYKDSGVEWLEEVPREWDIIKIKHLSTVKRGASPRPIDDPKYFDDNGEYAWVRIADVSASDMYLLNTTQTMSDLGSSLSVKLEPNQLFLSIAGTVGKPCINKIKACIHDGFVYFPELKIPNKYLFYVFAGEQAYKGLGKMGTQLNLNTDTVGDIKVALPKSQSDIYKIIEFLDHETTKIDHLIEKQQQLIELLKEKRQAVISHAVTKGLDPNVPMKDSGVEWLGQVPEHWTILKLSAIADITRLAGYEYTEYWQSDDEGEIIAIRGQNIRFNKLVNLDDAEKITNKLSIRLKRSRLYKNDIAYPCVGTIGNAVLIHESDKYHINQNIAKLTPNEKIYPLYLTYFLNSSICLESALFLNTSDAQPSILVGNLRKVKIAFPQLAEQIKIADSISNQLFMLDNLILKAELTISLMQERRTALISAAVTGKIDVRHWKAPTVAEADTELSA